MLRCTASGTDLRPGPWRAVFAWIGDITLDLPDRSLALAEGEAAPLGREVCRITSTAKFCCFVWEIDGPDRPLPMVPDGAETIAAHDMSLLPGEHPETGRDAALRCERVDLHPGVVTPRHTHRGSGLRVLTSGRLEAELDGVQRQLEPGDAWLEKGPGEVVVGRAAPEGRTAFVRLLVLPADCAGADSFVTLDESDAERPRPAAYRRFFEERVTL